MTEFESYKCPVCGAGTVSMQSAKGQTRHFRRGVARPVPATVLIPTCSACGEVFMGVEDSKRVDEALRAALQEEQPSRVVKAAHILLKVDELRKLERDATRKWVEAELHAVKGRPQAWEIAYAARDACTKARESFDLWLSVNLKNVKGKTRSR